MTQACGPCFALSAACHKCPLHRLPAPFYPVPLLAAPQQRPDQRSPDALVPVLRLATHADMHAIWQIDADVFGEDVYPGFFFRQAMDLWPELLVVAEREGWLLGYALGLGQDRSQAGCSPSRCAPKRAASAWPSK